MKTELCAGTESAVRIAKTSMIDRVELCQQLEIGGITPSIGLQQFSVANIETHVLIRPRGGDFVYSDDEKEVMLKDISASASVGVAGVVVGALDVYNQLDLDWLREARKSAKGLELTFHKAFDEVTDWRSALEDLVSMGFQRILTAGQAQNAWEGREVLRSMKAFANGKIEVMAGGGVNAENAGMICATAVLDALHFSGTVLQKASGTSPYAVDRLLPDPEKIAQILKAIGKF